MSCAFVRFLGIICIIGGAADVAYTGMKGDWEAIVAFIFGAYLLFHFHTSEE